MNEPIYVIVDDTGTLQGYKAYKDKKAADFIAGGKNLMARHGDPEYHVATLTVSLESEEDILKRLRGMK